MHRGYIKIWRGLFDNPFYFSEPFTRTQAWIDLLLLANHTDGFFYKRGNKIDVKRGCVGYSKLALSKRWQWSETKVKRFLKDLEKEKQIEEQKIHRITTLFRIVNYEQYQGESGQTEVQKADRKRTESGQKATNKNEKEMKKNGKEVKTKEKPIEKREADFIDSAKQFSSLCRNTKTLANFISYWTEKNKSGRKMKFEQQPTWDTKRRLEKWISNDFDKTESPVNNSRNSPVASSNENWAEENKEALSKWS